MKGYLSPFGFAISIAGHVVLLVLLLSFGSSKPEVAEAPKPAVEETPEPAETEPAKTVETQPAKTVEAPVKPVDEPVPVKPVVADRTLPEERPVPPPKVVREKKKPVEQVKEPKEPEAPRRGVITYTVKKGDSLTALAKGAACTVSELAKLNGKTVKALSNLRVGQKIKLPKAD